MRSMRSAAPFLIAITPCWASPSRCAGELAVDLGSVAAGGRILGALGPPIRAALLLIVTQFPQKMTPVREWIRRSRK
jgi:hypothetical protein